MQRCQGAALVGRAHHWIWRVTTDDPTSVTSQQTDALRSLPKRATIRTVFDPPAGWARTWWRRSSRLGAHQHEAGCRGFRRQATGL